MTRKVTFYAVFIWSLSILYFFYEYFIRVLPATISTNIIHDMHVTPEQFALFGSAYYLIYSFMQTFVGILYDRYGVKLFLSIACAVCTAGVFGFAFTDSFAIAIISRFLMGLGSSFGFLSLLILALNWFPQKHFGFLAGLGQMLGGVGPILAGAPVAYLMLATHGNWRLIFFGIGIFGSCLTAMIALFIRNQPKPEEHEIVYLPKKQDPLLQRLGHLLKIGQVWTTMFYAAFIYVSLPLLGAYWGTYYLQLKHFERPTAALMVSMIWLGLSIGSPILGRCSDWMKRRKPCLLFSAFLGIVATICILFFQIENKPAMFALFFAIGFSGAGQSLSFATIFDNVPEDLQGTALGANNTMIMFFASLLPLLATTIIQRQIGSQASPSPQDFELGFLLMPISFTAAFLIALFGIHETHCRQKYLLVPIPTDSKGEDI